MAHTQLCQAQITRCNVFPYGEREAVEDANSMTEQGTNKDDKAGRPSSGGDQRSFVIFTVLTNVLY